MDSNVYPGADADKILDAVWPDRLLVVVHAGFPVIPLIACHKAHLQRQIAAHLFPGQDSAFVDWYGHSISLAHKSTELPPSRNASKHIYYNG
jgi:hypothetical protein